MLVSHDVVAAYASRCSARRTLNVVFKTVPLTPGQLSLTLPAPCGPSVFRLTQRSSATHRSAGPPALAAGGPGCISCAAPA